MAVTNVRVPYRYRDSFYVAYKNPDGSYDVTVAFRDPYFEITNVRNMRKHRVGSKQTLQDIALEYYKVPELWYIIADANYEIKYPYDTLNMQGELINIPPVNVTKVL